MPPQDDESVPPQADEAGKPKPSQVVEAEKPVPPQEFGGGPIELSLLPLYLNHTSIHMWDREVKLVGFILFKLCLLLYYIFMT